MTTTKRRLIDGALQAIRVHGIAGVSARTVAAAAGVNQALVFYHFGTVDELLAAACRTATAERVERYRDRFAAVTSLPQLLDLGRELHAEETRQGNVTVLAQLLAGVRTDARLAAPVREALHLWTDEIRAVLDRLLAGSPLADVTDAAGLAHAVGAAFVGVELYEGADPAGAGAALDALHRLAVLFDVVDDLGPVARRALRTRARKATARKATAAGKATARRPLADPGG